jgi:hypothetical protein
VFAFVLLQFTMLGVFAIQRQTGPSALMIPAMAATIAYAIYMAQTFELGLFYVNLSEARRFDLHQLVRARQLQPLQYRLPALHAPAMAAPQSVSEMLAELARFKDQAPADEPDLTAVEDGSEELNEAEVFSPVLRPA